MAEYAVTLRDTMKYSRAPESRRPRVIQNPYATTPIRQTRVLGDLPALRSEEILHELYNNPSLDVTVHRSRVLVRTEDTAGTDISKFVYSSEGQRSRGQQTNRLVSSKPEVPSHYHRISFSDDSTTVDEVDYDKLNLNIGTEVSEQLRSKSHPKTPMVNCHEALAESMLPKNIELRNKKHQDNTYATEDQVLNQLFDDIQNNKVKKLQQQIIEQQQRQDAEERLKKSQKLKLQKESDDSDECINTPQQRDDRRSSSKRSLSKSAQETLLRGMPSSEKSELLKSIMSTQSRYRSQATFSESELQKDQKKRFMSKEQQNELKIQQLMQQQQGTQKSRDGAVESRRDRPSKKEEVQLVEKQQKEKQNNKRHVQTNSFTNNLSIRMRRSGYTKPRIAGDYMYEFLDTLVSDKKIVAITKISTGQRVYKRVPRLEYEKLIAHENIRNTVVGQSVIGSRVK